MLFAGEPLGGGTEVFGIMALRPGFAAPSLTYARIYIYRLMILCSFTSPSSDGSTLFDGLKVSLTCGFGRPPVAAVAPLEQEKFEASLI